MTPCFSAPLTSSFGAYSRSNAACLTGRGHTATRSHHSGVERASLAAMRYDDASTSNWPSWTYKCLYIALRRHFCRFIGLGQSCLRARKYRCLSVSLSTHMILTLCLKYIKCMYVLYVLVCAHNIHLYSLYWYNQQTNKHKA